MVYLHPTDGVRAHTERQANKYCILYVKSREDRLESSLKIVIFCTLIIYKIFDSSRIFPCFH